MDEQFFPMELFTKCSVIVKETRKRFGVGSIPAKVAAGKYLVALGMIPSAFAILQATADYYRLRILSWILALITLVLSIFASWDFIIGFLMILILERLFATKERDRWMMLQAVLLSLEMLTNDFAGWGSAFPEDREKALEILNEEGGTPTTTWLDFYLPRRMNISPDTLKSFGPNEAIS